MRLTPSPIQHFHNNDGTLLVDGKLYTYAAGGTTPLATYTDSTGGTEHDNPIILDARGEAAIWLTSSKYKFALHDADDAEIWVIDQIGDDTYTSWLTNIGGTDTVTATASGLTAYVTGQKFSFIAANANTGPATLNINSIGSKALTKNGSTALASDDIPIGKVINVTYDGTRFQLDAQGSVDDSLVVVLQSGTGAVERTQNDKNADTVSVKDYGAIGDGTTDDTAAIQAAIDALQSGQTLIIDDDHKITGNGLTITDKSRITIRGSGRLKLVGAAVDAVLLRPEGTCDRINISGLSFVGEGNSGATYFQYGIWNNSTSAPTLTNITVAFCYFKNLNAGISFNADSGGTYTNAIAYGNIIEDMVGTIGGQGYGIHASKVTNCQIIGNIINRCSRHSVYVARGAVSAGTDYGVHIHDNVIRDHRLTGHDGNKRPAIYCARGFGYSIKNNKIINYYDGAITVSQDTVDGTSCGDCVVSGNYLYGRMNAVPSICVGESSNPTSYRINNVRISNNFIRTDISVGGYTQELSIFNGLNIDVTNNDLFVANITNIAYRPIVLGEYSAAGATDLDRVNILRNSFKGSSSYVPVRFVYCGTAICSGSSRVRVEHNEIDNALLNSMIEYQATQTNKKIVARELWGGIAGTYTDADATPSVFGGVTYMAITNSGAVSITSLIDPSPQQLITLIFSDSNTTIKHATGNIRLVTGSDFAATSRDTLILLYSPVYTQWLEVSRSVNS